MTKRSGHHRCDDPVVAGWLRLDLGRHVRQDLGDGAPALEGGGGAGHGQHALPPVLTREARLALSPAGKWCELVLDMPKNERALWRRSESKRDRCDANEYQRDGKGSP